MTTAISTLTISEIKLAVSELLGFESTVNAQDIKNLSASFESLAEIIQGKNFSKKETWLLIFEWAQDETDPEIEVVEFEATIFPIEEIEVVDDCHFEIIPYTGNDLILAEQSEKSAVYFAFCCLVVFCILVCDLIVWIFTWVIPALAKFINSTVEKIQDVYRLYQQVKGINYLFIQ